MSKAVDNRRATWQGVVGMARSLNPHRLFAIIFVLLFLFLPLFGQASYVNNILAQSVVLAIMALGQTFVIILGGIDLSVGSVGALAGALTTGLIVNQGLSPLIAIMIALLIGMGIGAINGTLVYRFSIPPFVATLSMLAIARGLTLLYTNGTPIFSDHPLFTGLSRPLLLGISPIVMVSFMLYILAYAVLKYTTYGLHTYAIGNHQRTARLSGVAVGRVVIVTYIVCSFCAALGGVALASRLWSAQPNAALGFELNVIAVVVLGGASLFGGIGTVQGTLIGVLMLGFLASGMNLLQIPAYMQRVVWGGILVSVVGLDIRIRSIRARAGRR